MSRAIDTSPRYMTANDISAIGGTGTSFTLNAWLNASAGNGGMIVITNAGVTRYISMRFDNSANLIAECYDGTHDPNVVGPAFTGGVMEMATIVRDAGAGLLRTYRNGVAGATVADTSLDLTGTRTIYLGYDPNVNKALSAIFCEPAIWDVALSASEIADMYTNLKGANCEQSSHLKGWWKMDTNTSPEPDTIAANDATLVNAPAFSSSHPTLTYCGGASIVPIIMHTRRQRMN